MAKIMTTLDVFQGGSQHTFNGKADIPSSPPSGSVYELQRADYVVSGSLDPMAAQNIPVVTGFWGVSGTEMPLTTLGNAPHVAKVFQDSVYAFSPIGLFTASGARDLTSGGSFSFDRHGVQMPMYGIMVPEPGALRAFVSDLWVFGIFDAATNTPVNLRVTFQIEYTQRKAKPGEIENLLLMCAC